MRLRLTLSVVFVNQFNQIDQLAHKLTQLTDEVNSLKRNKLYTTGHLRKIDNKVDNLRCESDKITETIKRIEDNILALQRGRDESLKYVNEKV